MIAEKDPFIIPRPAGAKAAGSRAAARKFFLGFGKTVRVSKPARGRMRRGEHEAKSLLWRRRLKLAQRIASVVLLAGMTGSAIIIWRTGTVTNAGQDIAAQFDNIIVHAGLTIEEVRIKGQYKTPLAEIKKALGVRYGDSIFALNLEAARERIERLNWVRSASLSRQLPNNLQVNITERIPYALWQRGGELWLIDAEGTPITRDGLGAYATLPMVVGKGAPGKAVGLYALLDQDKTIRERIRSAVRVSDRRWDLMLKNGVRVRLPDDKVEEAYARLGRLERRTHILERDVAIVDMRFTGRVVVRLDHNAAEMELRGDGMDHDQIRGKISGPGTKPVYGTDNRNHGDEI